MPLYSVIRFFKKTIIVDLSILISMFLNFNVFASIDQQLETTNKTNSEYQSSFENSKSSADIIRLNIHLNNLKKIEKHYLHSKKGESLLDDIHKELCAFSINGDAEAQYTLGWMYENGVGVSNSPSSSEQLYRLSASNGYQPAADILNQYHFNLNENILQDKLPKCMQPKIIYETQPEPKDDVVSEFILNMAKTHENIYTLVNKISSKYHLDSNLVLCFIATESNFNERAVSEKNAQGLMQLIPETATRFGVKDPFKAEDNVKGGMAYLEWLLAYYRGNVALVAAAYNAGEGAVDRYQGIPPYKETQLYVNKILNLYNKKTHQFREGFIKPSPICARSC